MGFDAVAKSPDAGEPGNALGHYAEVGAGADQRILHEADKIDGAEMRAVLAGPLAAQIDDGVADELTRAVIGHVAAAIDLMHFNSAARQPLVANQNVGVRRVAPQRNHRRMLQQQERVTDEVLLARRDDALLNFQRFSVRHAAERE